MLELLYHVENFWFYGSIIVRGITYNMDRDTRD